MKRAKWTPGRCQVQTAYLIICKDKVSTMGQARRVTSRAFIKPHTKLILNISFLREVILVELWVNDVSQCRRSRQRVGHVQIGEA